MPRVSRLFLAAALSTLAALLPVTALAETTLIENVVGAQLPVFEKCGVGGTTSTFAGYGTTPSGQVNAAFSTTICHTGITSAGAGILPGGSFILAMSSLTLVGQYTGGTVGQGVITPLYPRSKYFCKEVFPVTADLGRATYKVPAGATNIKSGTVPAGMGWLTHYGRTAGLACLPFAASIAGTATLVYP